ncbi:putative ribokinase/pfkB superfamily isoform X3 [Glycine max]|nr:putative ribokinase/pfkB superfamily isoform X3 [Glycine max]
MSRDCDSLPENTIVVGCGAAGVDFLATVATYPKPDDKIRSTSFKIQGGGNAGNALTCTARLGLKPRIISKVFLYLSHLHCVHVFFFLSILVLCFFYFHKVADDTQGREILHELEVDGVDTSFMAVSKEGTSPFTYIIVDSQTKSRTCIHTPGFPPMKPDDLPESNLLTALNGARIVYLDGRLHETALVVAHEAWTEASTVSKALVCMLLRLPNIKFVIATLGKDGCIMLERCVNEDPSAEEVVVDKLLESLEMRKNGSTHIPTCISSPVTKLHAEGIGTVCSRLYIGTAKNIPPSELIDTTGAGDAFIGAVLYAICANFEPEKMLCFAATVAASKCRALGARSGLPYRIDPCLASFMQ